MTVLGVEYGCKYVLTGPDGTRAVFNDSTDPDFVGILGPETSGLDSADVREDATDAVEEDGGHHGDFYDGRRPVVLVGTIIASSATNRNEKSRRLKLASRALRKDATLKWQPAGGPEVELLLRRQQPLRITKGYVKDFQIPMVAADPYPRGTTKRFDLSDGEPNWLTTPTETFSVVTSSEYVYWADQAVGAIGRAKLDGSSPSAEWLTTPNVGVRGLDINSEFIYWADQTVGAIGRAKLDGSSPSAEWLTTPSTGVMDVIVNSEFIYWSDQTLGAIGRAKLDGSSPAAEWLTTPSTKVWGLALDATYIYWMDAELGAIGRAKLDGSSPAAEWLTTPTTSARGLSVDSNFIYWNDVSSGDVGRAKIDGTSPTNEWWTTPSSSGFSSLTAPYFYMSAAGSLARRRTSWGNEGDVPAYPVIKVLKGKTFKIENETTKQYILLEGVKVEGSEYLEINFKNHTILKNGTTYAYNALVFASSSWWQLEPGENRINVTGGEAEIEWRDTYA